MAYESGNSPEQKRGNRYQAGSYQSSGNYQPPAVQGTYAEKQTQVMEDTMRTHYNAEGTAATVLSQLTTQRQQLTGAHENVWEMRQAAEKAKKDLASLAAKQRWKKQRLQLIAMALAVTDFFLFIRLLRCGGSFFCKQQVEYY